MNWYSYTEQYSFTFLTIVQRLARWIPSSRKKGHKSCFIIRGHCPKEGCCWYTYEWNVGLASKGVLLQPSITSVTKLLPTKATETESRKLLCLTSFLWVKQDGSSHQLGSARVSGSQHNTTTSASVAKKHIAHTFHSHTLGALSMMSTYRVVLGRTADSLPRWRWHISGEKGPFSRVSSPAHVFLGSDKDTQDSIFQEISESGNFGPIGSIIGQERKMPWLKPRHSQTRIWHKK